MTVSHLSAHPFSLEGVRAVLIRPAILLALTAAIARAQMPGVPVLQNAFTNPGVTLAVNAGTSTDAKAYAGAAAWAPSSGRFQLSLGAGGFDPKTGKMGIAYGVRAAVPLTFLPRSESYGISLFAGFGGASPDTLTLNQVPVGLGIGYRRALGATRGISLYATPTYLFARQSGGGTSTRKNLLRASVGLDVTLISSLGLTLGYELGAEAKAGEAGPSAPIFGLGLSYALR
jgi:hypothetical protein